MICLGLMVRRELSRYRVVGFAVLALDGTSGLRLFRADWFCYCCNLGCCWVGFVLC